MIAEAMSWPEAFAAAVGSICFFTFLTIWIWRDR